MQKHMVKLYFTHHKTLASFIWFFYVPYIPQETLQKEPKWINRRIIRKPHTHTQTHTMNKNEKRAKTGQQKQSKKKKIVKKVERSTWNFIQSYFFVVLILFMWTCKMLNVGDAVVQCLQYKPFQIKFTCYLKFWCCGLATRHAPVCRHVRR